MKRPTLANENMVSLYSGRSYLTSSTKSPLASYQKSFGVNFNSPKSETQKGFAFPQKTPTTNLRSSSKVDTTDSGIERKNSKNNSESYSRVPSTNSTYAGTSASSRPNKLRGSSTKTSSADKYKIEQSELTSTGKQYGSPKFSETINLRDSLLKQSKGRALEINTDIQTFKTSGGLKAYSTKNKDSKERSLVGSGSHSSLEYSKYMAGQNSSSQIRYEYNRTEPNEEKSSITPTNKPKSVLNRILTNANEKSHSSTIRRQPTQEDDSLTHSASPPTGLKVNNFFASAKRKELESSFTKKDKTLNMSAKFDNDREELAKSAEFNNKKLANKVQQEYKASYKAMAFDESKEEIRRQEQDSKNLSLSYASGVNRDQKPATSSQKSSLSSFITKVDKGTTLPVKVKKDEDKEDFSGNGPVRPYLTLEDKANARSNKNEESISKTSTNSESKTITFSKNRLNQQALASSTQEGNKTRNKLSGGSPGLRDSSQDKWRENEVSPTKTDSFTYYVTSLEKHHRNWNESDYFCQIYKEHFIQSFQALTFCRYLKPVDPKVLAQKKVFLPKRPTHKDKKSIIFDLDETLIHCNESTDMPCDVLLPIRFPHGEIIEAGINIRPYAIEILKEISQHFEVIIFTASHSCYANVVLDYLDPNNQYIHHRLFRDSCVVTDEGIYIKDLRILGNRNLQDIVLVDNAAYSFGYQIENGIPVIPYYDNKDDQELKHLIPYLKSLANAKDLREVNKQTFKLNSYSMYDTLDKVLNKVVLQN